MVMTRRKAKLFDFDFHPSPIMVKFAQEYIIRIEDGRDVSPWLLLEELGTSRQNWYNWQKKEGFTKWFLKMQENFHKTLGLANVHQSIYKHAIKESPPDRKLMLERFDESYKPKVEQQFTFVGTRPDDDIDIEDLKDKSEKFRKAVESHEV